MNDPLNDLKNQWKSARKEQPTDGMTTGELISQSKEKMRRTVMMHVETIAILVFTLLGIAAFFIWVAPFRETLSHIGMTLMLGGLTIRILIEFYSIYRSRKIDLSSNAATANAQFYSFYSYRKKTHGPITISILIAYTIGFYLLIPEFSNYVERVWVILFAVSYLPAAAIFGISTRMGIRKEMNQLNEIKALQEELAD